MTCCFFQVCVRWDRVPGVHSHGLLKWLWKWNSYCIILTPHGSWQHVWFPEALYNPLELCRNRDTKPIPDSQCYPIPNFIATHSNPRLTLQWMCAKLTENAFQHSIWNQTIRTEFYLEKRQRCRPIHRSSNLKQSENSRLPLHWNVSKG